VAVRKGTFRVFLAWMRGFPRPKVVRECSVSQAARVDSPVGADFLGDRRGVCPQES